jgi:hypothetical protein
MTVRHLFSGVENTGVEPVTSSPKAFGAYKRPNPAQKFLSGEYRSRTGDLFPESIRGIQAP